MKPSAISWTPSPTSGSNLSTSALALAVKVMDNDTQQAATRPFFRFRKGGPEVNTRGAGKSMSRPPPVQVPQVREKSDGWAGSRYRGCETMVRVSVHICLHYRFHKSVTGVTGGPEVATRSVGRWLGSQSMYASSTGSKSL